MAVQTLYKVTYRDPEEGHLSRWFTTFNKAAAFARREKISDYARIEPVEVPTGKATLCEWLNVNVNASRS